MDLEQMRKLVVTGSAFGLVLALWSGAVLAWWWRSRSRREQLRRRLELGAEDTASEGRRLRLWHEGEEVTAVVPELPRAPGLSLRLELLRRSAGIQAPLRRIVARACGAAACAALVLGIVTGDVLPAVVGAAAVLMGIWAWAHKRAAKRDALFEAQLVDALDLSARSLRAGHPLLASFQLIADEVPAPVGALFGEVCQQQALGVPVDEALRRTARLVRNRDIELFSAALSIHLRCGGNLADVMHGIAGVIRQRMRLNRRFRVLVAQTQVSKRILIAMPFMIFVVLNLISADYMRVLYGTPAGQLLLLVAGSGLGVGWLVMNRMATLEA